MRHLSSPHSWSFSIPFRSLLISEPSGISVRIAKRRSNRFSFFVFECARPVFFTSLWCGNIVRCDSEEEELKASLICACQVPARILSKTCSQWNPGGFFLVKIFSFEERWTFYPFEFERKTEKNTQRRNNATQFCNLNPFKNRPWQDVSCLSQREVPDRLWSTIKKGSSWSCLCFLLLPSPLNKPSWRLSEIFSSDTTPSAEKWQLVHF